MKHHSNNFILLKHWRNTALDLVLPFCCAKWLIKLSKSHKEHLAFSILLCCCMYSSIVFSCSVWNTILNNALFIRCFNGILYICLLWKIINYLGCGWSDAFSAISVMFSNASSTILIFLFLQSGLMHAALTHTDERVDACISVYWATITNHACADAGPAMSLPATGSHAKVRVTKKTISLFCLFLLELPGVWLALGDGSLM